MRARDYPVFVGVVRRFGVWPFGKDLGNSYMVQEAEQRNSCNHT